MQSDVTVFELKDGSRVEICNFPDDFSRVCVASKVLSVTTAPDVVATLDEAGSAWGLPASLLTDVVRWVDTQDESDIRTALIQTNDDAALQAATATWNREERAKSSVYTTAETVLAAYADPVVAASAESHRITPRRLLDGGAHTLYVVAPSHEQRRLRPLFQTLIATILATAYERASEEGGPVDPALVVARRSCQHRAPA